MVGQLLACRRTGMSSHPMSGSFGRRRVWKCMQQSTLTAADTAAVRRLALAGT